ncbi:primosomal protein N' [Saxibacter everestensis]|uniref:Probable replication restart protein PriA n=1 Tax=Saxibacter everestensis TaxID=2909229 RepID=A0ABY8QY10_9MICO|nr:primosomal protein N' [Brevibacteriaceae bacterium ZFBP1038]
MSIPQSDSSPAAVPAAGRPDNAAETGLFDGLLTPAVSSGSTSNGIELAAENHIAEVLIDAPVPHLDRVFDYYVSADQDADAQFGVRVRVRFAGRDVDGFIVCRKAETDHVGELTTLGRVVSPVPILTREVLGLAEAVADRYAGTRSDVLRLAIPPRHARTEKQILKESQGSAGSETAIRAGDLAPGDWSAYGGGAAFLRHLAEGQAPRAALTAIPGDAPGTGWAALVARAASAVQRSGRSALIVAPDYRDLTVLADALTAECGPAGFVRLSADEGPADRYASFLGVLLRPATAGARIVIGTRAAAFAPLSDLGLVVCWDEGNDLLAEQRAPYPHARDVLMMRAAQNDAGVLLAGYSRSTNVQRLVELGWCVDLKPDRKTLRQNTPRVVQPDPDRDSGARNRFPDAAFAIFRSALGLEKRQKHEPGPVLVQVPRAGYLPALACGTCRRSARCSECAGPLRQASPDQAPSCGWCGKPAGDFHCPECEGTSLRSIVIGADRTTEELGRAFPGIPMVRSGGDHVLHSVPDRPAIVVATVGAEPIADRGYAAAVLLDGEQLLSLPGLRAGEQALRRWLGAAALVRPSTRGGTVLLTADEPTTAGGLIRWDPSGYASRELVERRELRLPPSLRVATLSGASTALNEALSALELPESVDVLGPAPTEHSAGGAPRPGAPDDDYRLILRFSYADGPGLTRQLRHLVATRSARKDPEIVHVQVDGIHSL